MQKLFVSFGLFSFLFLLCVKWWDLSWKRKTGNGESNSAENYNIFII